MQSERFAPGPRRAFLFQSYGHSLCFGMGSERPDAVRRVIFSSTRQA